MNKQAISKFIIETQKKWHVPGVAVSIVKDNEVLLNKGYGFRNIQKKDAVTPDTLFPIASCSKAFTTFAMAMLVDEKKLDWDTPVQQYLPQFRLKDSFASERITPRDLVTHRSGLPRHDKVWYISEFTREELVRNLAHLEPNKDFRTYYQYNNLMFVAAGYLIEKVSGLTWEAFVREKIFTVLGMEQSSFSIKDMLKSSNYALPYQYKNNQIMKIPYATIDAIGPAGSINSSIQEMSHWVQFHLNKGKIGNQSIISKEQLTEMYLPQQVIQEPMDYDELFHRCYGLGWVIRSYRGHKLVYHTGSMDGFASHTSFMPQHNLGIVILCNLDETILPSVLVYSLYDRLLGMERKPWHQRFLKEVQKETKEAKKEKDKLLSSRKKGTKPGHRLSEYIGQFQHKGYGQVIVEIKNKTLTLKFNAIKYSMKHFHYETFLIEYKLYDRRFLVTYQSNSKGEIISISIPFEPAVKEIVFERVK